MHVAGDCACFGLKVANNGSDNLKVCHDGILLAFRRDAKNNFVGMVGLSSITLDAVKQFASGYKHFARNISTENP